MYLSIPSFTATTAVLGYVGNTPVICPIFGVFMFNVLDYSMFQEFFDSGFEHHNLGLFRGASAPLVFGNYEIIFISRPVQEILRNLRQGMLGKIKIY